MYNWAVPPHRISLDDADILLIVSALRARRAMSNGLREHRIDRLITRLSEGRQGNPKLTLGEYEQTHEDELDAEDM